MQVIDYGPLDHKTDDWKYKSLTRMPLNKIDEQLLVLFDFTLFTEFYHLNILILTL